MISDDDLPPEARELADGLGRLFADELDPFKRYALHSDAVRDFQQDLKIKRRRGELDGVKTTDWVSLFSVRLWSAMERHLDRT